MTLISGNVVRDRLLAGERMLVDGAMGTELIRLGVMPEDTLRANRGTAALVTGIHQSYLSAGAQILVSNTFGLREGTDWQSNIQSGIELAVNSARKSDSSVAVMVSLSCSLVLREEATLPYLISHATSWPGFILIETCTSLPEAVEATQAVRKCTKDLLAVTCHFQMAGCMPDGSSPKQVAMALLECGADIVGGNCGETPDAFVQVAKEMREVTEAPLYFAPSAGLPTRMATGEWIYPIRPEEFADTASKLADAGVNLIGGCCGTTPAYIAAIKQRIF